MHFDIKPTFLVGVLVGGLILGVGFGLGGGCPGTCVVGIGDGRTAAPRTTSRILRRAVRPGADADAVPCLVGECPMRRRV